MSSDLCPCYKHYFSEDPICLRLYADCPTKGQNFDACEEYKIRQAGLNWASASKLEDSVEE